MPRWSAVDREMLHALRNAQADASSARALASRVLAIVQERVAFDEGYILAVDPGSLLFTSLLAYRGRRFTRFVHWLRDVYLVVERQVLPDIAFPNLLRDHGGFVVLHERIDRWIGSVARPPDQELWIRTWRTAGSPPGGGFRLGFADRGRWVAAMQAARWRPGPGYRRVELEALRHAAPAIARALRARLEREHRPASSHASLPPNAGHLVFSPDRVLAFVDQPGEAWIDRLPDDDVRSHGMVLPIAAQALVNHLASDPNTSASSRLVDRFGQPVLVQATAARDARDGPPARWIHVTVEPDRLGGGLPLAVLTARQRQVGLAVAQGLSDRAIADRLGISTTTVHDHVAALHAACGTTTRAALVAALMAAPAPLPDVPLGPRMASGSPGRRDTRPAHGGDGRATE